MARETFILHTQQMSALAAVLSDQQLGRLMRAVFEYEAGIEPVVPDDVLASWAMLRVQLQANRERYEDKCQRNRENIRKRWDRQDTNVYDRIQSNTTEYDRIRPNTNVYECIPNNKDNNKDNKKKENIISKDIIKERIEPALPPSPAHSKRFVKPTVEEIAAYCKERKNGIDAQHFYDYYEGNGWRRGNTPLKDWKACVRTWEQRHDFLKPLRSGAPAVPDINDFRNGDNQY